MRCEGKPVENILGYPTTRGEVIPSYATWPYVRYDAVSHGGGPEQLIYQHSQSDGERHVLSTHGLFLPEVPGRLKDDLSQMQSGLDLPAGASTLRRYKTVRAPGSAFPVIAPGPAYVNAAEVLHHPASHRPRKEYNDVPSTSQLLQGRSTPTPFRADTLPCPPLTFIDMESYDGHERPEMLAEEGLSAADPKRGPALMQRQLKRSSSAKGSIWDLFRCCFGRKKTTREEEEKVYQANQFELMVFASQRNLQKSALRGGRVVHPSGHAGASTFHQQQRAPVHFPITESGAPVPMRPQGLPRQTLSAMEPTSIPTSSYACYPVQGYSALPPRPAVIPVPTGGATASSASGSPCRTERNRAVETHAPGRVPATLLNYETSVQSPRYDRATEATGSISSPATGSSHTSSFIISPRPSAPEPAVDAPASYTPVQGSLMPTSSDPPASVIISPRPSASEPAVDAPASYTPVPEGSPMSTSSDAHAIQLATPQIETTPPVDAQSVSTPLPVVASSPLRETSAQSRSSHAQSPTQPSHHLLATPDSVYTSLVGPELSPYMQGIPACTLKEGTSPLPDQCERK